MEAIASLGAGTFRLMFTTENADEVCLILENWMNGAKPQMEFTRGHFKRGVE
jgi:hypothetical protein